MLEPVTFAKTLFPNPVLRMPDIKTGALVLPQKVFAEPDVIKAPVPFPIKVLVFPEAFRTAPALTPNRVFPAARLDCPTVKPFTEILALVTIEPENVVVVATELAVPVLPKKRDWALDKENESVFASLKTLELNDGRFSVGGCDADIYTLCLEDYFYNLNYAILVSE